MIITFWKGIFVADSVDEKGALKKAGFEMHEPTTCNLKGDSTCKACRAKIGRRFWSNRVEAATRMERFCNERALRVMKTHLELLKKSRATDAQISIPAPPGLAYLPYQKAGIAYALQRKDTLIADDMGLGKSVEALGFLNVVKPRNAIIVCPATLIFNWRLEADKWLYGFPADLCIIESKKQIIPNQDGLVAIVNYEKLGGDTPLMKSINERQWDVGIFDEAQYIKNPESSRSKAIIGPEGVATKVKRALFLTGTPIENYPKEIWPIAAFLNPAKFGNWWDFAKRYCTPPESPAWFGDFSFRPIGTVKIGDKLIGWRKRSPTKAGHERLELCRTTVTAVNRRISKIVKVTMASGRILRCTPDHRWLAGSNKKEFPWTSTKVGRSLCHVMDPPKLLPEKMLKDAHWLGGIFDGEGTGSRIAQSKKHNPEIYKHIEKTLEGLKLPHSKSKDGMGFNLSGGRKAAVEFLNWCKPIKTSRWIDKRVLTSKFRTIDRIVKVEDDGKGEVVSLTTSTGNYIVWGYASKNCSAHQEDRKFIDPKTGEARWKKVWVTEGASNLGELQQRLRASFMVRRLKKDVLPELPPKRRQLIVLHDSKKDWSKDPRFQRWQRIYEQKYEEIEAKIEASKTEEEYRNGASELEAITGIGFTEMSEVRHEVANAKLPLCIKYIDETLAAGTKNLVIFAHHRDVIEALAAKYPEAAVVHGGTPSKGPKSREEAVKSFQEGRKKIFIGQIRAAGVGLTLTAADTVIFVEVDWVPGVVTQCEDRLCRIGQKKMVHVIHLVLGGTMEVNMIHKLIKKQDVIDKALDKMPEIKLKRKAS